MSVEGVGGGGTILGVAGPSTLAVYATACLLFPASFQVGAFFNSWHLPIISGYLVTGVRALVALPAAATGVHPSSPTPRTGPTAGATMGGEPRRSSCWKWRRRWEALG